MYVAIVCDVEHEVQFSWNPYFCNMNIREKANQDKPQATDPILSSNNESHSWFQSEQFKALAMMKDKVYCR